MGKCPNITPTLLCKQKMLDLYISSVSKPLFYHNFSVNFMCISKQYQKRYQLTTINKKRNGVTAKHKIKLKVFFTKIQSYYLLQFKVGLQDKPTMRKYIALH